MLKFNRSTVIMMVLLILAMGMPQLHAQSDQSSRDTEIDRVHELERKVDQLEERQKQSTEAVKAVTDSNRFYFTVLSVIVGVIVAIQSIFQGFAFFHERSRNPKRDKIGYGGGRLRTAAQKRYLRYLV